MKVKKQLILSIKKAMNKNLTIAEKISSWWHDLWCYTWGYKHIRDTYYNLKHLFFDRYDLIRTKLPKTKYYDTPILLLYGTMNLIVDLVEKEKFLEHVDTSSSTAWENAVKTVEEAYNWWKNYDNREKEIDIALNNWHSIKFKNCFDGDGYLAKLNTTDTLETMRYSDLYDYLKSKLEKEEQQMLLKVIKVREYLWT